jgi:hypothetical protein
MTDPPPSAAPTPPTGVMIVSIVSLGLLAASLAISAWLRNDNAMLLIIGAIVSNATTVVSWWVGSSKGSVDKSARIAEQWHATQTQAPPSP